MIISTSSYNVRLTDEICAYVEDTMRTEFGHLAENVVSVDARLEAIQVHRDRSDTNIVVRVDLHGYGAFITETRDKSLYGAIRRGAAMAAQATVRRQHDRRETPRQRPPARRVAFGRFSSASI